MPSTRAVDPRSLCTLDQVKLQLGITNTNSDALINQLIPNVSLEILNAINRLDLLPKADYDDLLCGKGDCKLYLKHYPIQEVTSVTIDDQDVEEWDGYSSSFGWFFRTNPNPENQQFLELIGVEMGCASCRSYCWPPSCPVPNIRIQYSAGYDTPPPPLTQAAIDFVAFKRNMALIQAADPLLSSRQMGDYSEQLGGGRGVIIDYMGIDIPASVKSVIDQYQRTVV